MKKGKGKRYYNKNNRIIKYEGEYSIKHGKGKEYYNNGKLKYEGEYLNDKMWNGKRYKKNKKDELKYEIKNG